MKTKNIFTKAIALAALTAVSTSVLAAMPADMSSVEGSAITANATVAARMKVSLPASLSVDVDPLNSQTISDGFAASTEGTMCVYSNVRSGANHAKFFVNAITGEVKDASHQKIAYRLVLKDGGGTAKEYAVPVSGVFTAPTAGSATLTPSLRPDCDGPGTNQAGKIQLKIAKEDYQDRLAGTYTGDITLTIAADI